MDCLQSFRTEGSAMFWQPSWPQRSRTIGSRMPDTLHLSISLYFNLSFSLYLSIYYLSISLYFNVRLGLSFLVLWQVVKQLSKACGKRMKKWLESSWLLQGCCTAIILTKTSGFYHEIQWTLLRLCSSQEWQIGEKQNSNWPQQRKEIHWFIKLKVPGLQLFTSCSSEIPGMESHWPGGLRRSPDWLDLGTSWVGLTGSKLYEPRVGEAWFHRKTNAYHQEQKEGVPLQVSDYCVWLDRKKP